MNNDTPRPNEGVRLPEEAAATPGTRRTTEYDGDDQIGAELAEDGRELTRHEGPSPQDKGTLVEKGAGTSIEESPAVQGGPTT